MCDLAARVAALIRIDAVWLATEPMDMRAGTDTALARVVKVFGAAHPHRGRFVFAAICPGLDSCTGVGVAIGGR